MRYFTGLLVALCLSWSMICAQDQPKLSPAQQEVLNVRKAVREATIKGDTAAWSRYVADDCIFSDDDGVLLTKAQMKADLDQEKKNWPPEYLHSDEPHDYVVHVYGKTAVITWRLTIHEQFTDTDVIHEQRYTETYIKQNGAWLLVARTLINLPVNFHKPVAVDTSVYKDYVGEYEARPHDVVDIVSVKDGKLWSHIGKEEDEYLPLGSDTFFVKNDLGSVTFSRDAQGRVTGYTYRHADGQETHSKKIK